jgi:hypothetical protein
MSPIKTLKKLLETMSPKSKQKKVQSMRNKNKEKASSAKRKLIYSRETNKIKTAKELKKVNNKLKKLKI